MPSSEKQPDHAPQPRDPALPGTPQATASQPFGFLLIDKPKDITSFYVVKTLRKIFYVKRIGYAGTLDPLATGLMIVAIGEATKLLNALEQMDKVYDVTIQFGATSETYDAEGPIHLFQNPRQPSEEEISQFLSKDFSGEQQQVPPRYSAVKIQGKRAYALARKGKEVQIPAKKVVFHDIKVRKFEYPFLECSVHCSSGTYIRSFAHDLGQKLGCGGYVQSLRRTKISMYRIEDSVPLPELTKENCRQLLIPPQKFLHDWQQCELTEDEYKHLCTGGFSHNRWKIKEGYPLAIFQDTNVGLLELCEEGRSMKFAKKFNLG